MEISRSTIKEVYLKHIKEDWLNADTSLPDFIPPILLKEKQANETFIRKTVKAFKKLKKDHSKRNALKLLNQVLQQENILGIHKVLDENTLTAFQTEMKSLLRSIRIFAPELELEDIGQALRNYSVYAMFNELHGVAQNCSSAIFGYSMLYPFTDNYIDNPLHSSIEKQLYNKLIKDKLSGISVTPICEHHEKTCRLLDAIESDYPREKDASIYTLLLLMLEAQEDSLAQQNEDIHLSLDDRLDISLYKGGVSVLIDRYFVHKEITQEDMYFYLAFGFFLQLADDLQDIGEDLAKGSQTLLNYEVTQKYAEKTVNQMFHFLHTLFLSYNSSKSTFQEFILHNSYQLILLSVLQSKEYFSDSYLSYIEGYLPITPAFIEELKASLPKNKDAMNQTTMMKLLDEMIEED